ncbi:sarcalumenin isoform X3 [Anopheles cruzii]|uniref:sarcalumenin isoform X3 n=1 Tax=Anopheles cruzii TaxID=68878 RepID=UPI0022EC986A|nr:sarcalumenin isoform X3 [Anopheles cruzii]
MKRFSVWVLLGLTLLSLGTCGFLVKAETPSEYECRPYIEKAIQDLKSESAEVPTEDASQEGPIDVTSQEEQDNTAAEELSTEDTDTAGDDASEEITPSEEVQEQLFAGEDDEYAPDSETLNVEDDTAAVESNANSEEEAVLSEEQDQLLDTNDEDGASEELTSDENEEDAEPAVASEETADQVLDTDDVDDDTASEELSQSEAHTEDESQEQQPSSAEEQEQQDSETGADDTADSEETVVDSEEQIVASEEENADEDTEDEVVTEASKETSEEATETIAEEDSVSTENPTEPEEESTENDGLTAEEEAVEQELATTLGEVEEAEAETDSEDTETDSKEESFPEEDLLLEYEIPTNLRDTSHVYELLNINDDASDREKALQETAEVILRDLKRIYDSSIKPLETLYKYRDLSNRHFGDPEIFSKPLVLLMGPWSGGKSTILNYLTHNEYTPNSVRTGAEPSPAYFNILMHGDEPDVLDGTQLAADWTFSGLQKFGQGLLDRLRGQRLPNKLLERVNIVEIPGILEVRKQVSKYFPFNDACQWFIDRADIIFLVYDPSKLDVGPETEAILDQLKGREYQTRILLNKADQVKPEELLRVQSALIWNISPLMSSAQPPVMYTVSLWSNPFEVGAPVRLLQAQERSLLLDLGQAIDKRIENKIASARRFAVRVRNHAKMVDCYLTTYYNHKSLFGNKKQISEKIIASPQDYHIYEGLSTLTNISRYDLPDPEVYRDFFHLNPLYDFKKLSETCTYFRGCPINKLDVAIAYDLPELVGKYKKMSEAALAKLHVLTSTTDFGKGKSSS